MASEKIWGGRFATATNEIVEAFTASDHFDRRLARYDIIASKAHSKVLLACGILDRNECQLITDGLDVISKEIADDEFHWLASLEDVHMNIEHRLTELIGDPGKKLHTARSRNDQTVTSLRLFVIDAIDQIRSDITELQHVLLDLAEREVYTIMPGMTHLQAAQPISCGHHLMAWNAMLDRDWHRLGDCRSRVNISPLGSAALAGTGFNIDREISAEELGFDSMSTNSIDSVSDRDFVLEFCADTAFLQVHLSRIAEELVLWSSQNFGFVDLGDAFCTGSSIMPQKKNPDVAELIRGKSGRAIGNLTALLVLMKGQPLAYNRDNQEDKEPVFDSFDNSHACLKVLISMFPQITFNKKQMLIAAGKGHTTATDLADYLVRHKVPFRDAHEIVGKAVRLADELQLELSDLSLEKLQTISDKINKDVFDILTLGGSIESRNHYGGTAPKQVLEAVFDARQKMSSR